MTDAVAHRPGPENGDRPDGHDATTRSTISRSTAIASIHVRFSVVEVRRHADACARTVIDDYVLSEEPLRDRFGVRHVDDHAPPRSSSRTGCSAVTGGSRLVHQAPREGERAGANRRHPDLRDNLVAGTRRVERGTLGVPL